MYQIIVRPIAQLCSMTIANHEFESFSTEELRLRLIQKFNQAGIRDKLTAQMRSKLFSELSLRTTVKPESQSSFLLSKVVDSLLIEYLQERNLEFTKSVFVPESGVGSIQQVLHIN